MPVTEKLNLPLVAQYLQLLADFIFDMLVFGKLGGQFSLKLIHLLQRKFFR